MIWQVRSNPNSMTRKVHQLTSMVCLDVCNSRTFADSKTAFAKQEQMAN